MVEAALARMRVTGDLIGFAKICEYCEHREHCEYLASAKRRKEKSKILTPAEINAVIGEVKTRPFSAK
jgi:hypothetical protein